MFPSSLLQEERNKKKSKFVNFILSVETEKIAVPDFAIFRILSGT